jgi:cellulose biosynthesis protein BcsQ
MWKTTQYAIFAHLGVSSQTWNNIYGRIPLSRLIFVSPPIHETRRTDRKTWKGSTMIVALLNQKGGVGKTTLALHLAGEWSREGKRVTVIDAGAQGSALDWSAQRAKEGVPRLFGVLGLARDTLHREAPELARDADHVIIDGPPRVAGLLRSALLAADLVLIPAQPSPFDGWASSEMLRLLEEARIFRRNSSLVSFSIVVPHVP